ncbi:hypothetical protein [Cohnella abietis]|uniref:Uncharacterized protein n=1 Tax=Cohnella abietis TaxID=2507935 RepID=A0A3T1CY95_9BACL|nr:hypothetical protein [Cohnella abietis]BBI30837.1 hypothetical protein KCTCHS21_02360 [Cohnella abietis]
MSDESTAENWKENKVFIWLGTILCAFTTLACIVLGDLKMILLTGGITAFCFWGLFAVHRQLSALPPYRPGKGFWFQRLTPSGKIRVLTVSQVLLFVLAIGSYLIGDISRHTRISTFGIAIVGFLLIQMTIKPRIKFHKPIDDATLFELEDLGIIRPNENVVGMYKDTMRWDSVNSRTKILLLTPNRLIAIRMPTPDKGERAEIRLSDINRLGLIGHGKKGEGLLLSVGLLDGSIIRFVLLGEGDKYSPEQFMQQLLELLDKRSPTQEGVTEPAPAIRVRPDGHKPVLQKSIPVLQPLDLQKESATAASGTEQRGIKF